MKIFIKNVELVNFYPLIKNIPITYFLTFYLSISELIFIFTSTIKSNHQ